MRELRHTQHAQASYFVHEEGRDNVSGQHGQRSQEVDEVDPVGAVVVVERHLAAGLVVVEGAVDHPRVGQFVVVDICKSVKEGAKFSDRGLKSFGVRPKLQGSSLLVLLGDTVQELLHIERFLKLDLFIGSFIGLLCFEDMVVTWCTFKNKKYQ